MTSLERVRFVGMTMVMVCPISHRPAERPMCLLACLFALLVPKCVRMRAPGVCMGTLQ